MEKGGVGGSGGGGEGGEGGSQWLELKEPIVAEEVVVVEAMEAMKAMEAPPVCKDRGPADDRLARQTVLSVLKRAVDRVGKKQEAERLRKEEAERVRRERSQHLAREKALMLAKDLQQREEADLRKAGGARGWDDGSCLRRRFGG